MTIRQLITDALQQNGAADILVAPDAASAARGLRVLQSMVLALPGMTQWTPVEISTDYTAGENERIRSVAATSVTISVPSQVTSASSLLWCCNTVSLICDGYDDRAPRDGARIQVAAEETVTYFYRADYGGWLRADALTLSSEIPINADFHEFLTAMLAVRLAPFEGVAVPDVAVALIREGQSRMRARYGKRQDVAAPLALINTSSNYPYEGLPTT